MIQRIVIQRYTINAYLDGIADFRYLPSSESNNGQRSLLSGRPSTITPIVQYFNTFRTYIQALITHAK